MTQFNGRDLPAGGITLGPGATYALPEGQGSIRFDDLKRYIGVDIRSTPGQSGVLVFSLLAVAGLTALLYVNRRRMWVRTGAHADGRMMVEYGLLARGEGHRLAAEATAIRALLAGLTINDKVAFEVDELVDDEAWSVVITGTARAIESQTEIDEADKLPLRPWIPTRKYTYVEITPTHVHGRHFELGEEPERY